ncbi:hypothetical protein BSF41_24230 [Flavobacterium sp. ACN2]|jgi:hypothetical protein|uniref:hypothetical protein n=1 Tax=unclassified Flavobacterium TaxID=196869 RepID=UPI000BB2DAAC|nr:hypothetical protein [Flavobacterium sp. ACN2]PBI89054.1 hypothetical protein BSF41_24230 [Flavobacterium sp. ACN2]
MKIELIPVIEVLNADQNIELPAFGPSWKYKDEWAGYYHLTNICAGFSNMFKPYSKGLSLYKIDEISDIDLLCVIKKEIDIQQTDDYKGVKDLECSFSGGYILNIDDKAVYYPQCCGSLSDIKEWENLIMGITESFYIGHPFPRVTEVNNKIRFDFVDIEVKEKFVPPVLYNIIDLEKSDLEFAIIEVNKVLEIFASRLRLINQTEKLNITNIDKVLIWGENE